jgi:hypothetical protein
MAEQDYAASECGARIEGPNDPLTPIKFRYYTCSLSAAHEGEHEDEDGHASWPRGFSEDSPA